MLTIFLLLFLAPMAGTATAAAATAKIKDTRGRTIHFDAPPTRVVSIVPSATEIICTLKAADALTGVTFHSTLPVEKNGKTVVGGFLSPDLGMILKLDPDLVFVTGFQEDTARELEAHGIKTLYIDTLSFEQSLDNIRMIGAIFDREKEAEASIATIRDQIETVRQKVAKIPMDQRKRVFRLMGRESVMTPARGAFLNDLVRLAGGIPMAPEADGMVAEVTLKQWKAFNPQVIFGCGGDKKAAETFFTRPGWKDADGVKNHKIYYFPCELTCRAACHTGYFVQWLASFIYSDHFFTPGNLVNKDAKLAGEPVPIDLGIIKKSQRVKVSIADFTHKTLVIDFKSPQTILSTLEGLKHNIATIANHYLPPPSWTMPHAGGMAGTKQRILSAVERDPASTSLLMTGANMDHVTVTEKSYKKMRAIAVVTAGICSNAQRMSRAVGGYYEPGTINIMVMTNMRLSQRAMARAMITATEAKTAAMSDLDIRSSYQSLDYQATGTGTDNIIMVQGEGSPIDNTGGHSKMGELIAKAVYDGVTKAVFLQNGLKSDRNIFQRLKERGITASSLVKDSGCQCAPGTLDRMAIGLEALLMEPKYAGLVETALAVSDARNKGLIHDLSLFSNLGRTAAEAIAGEPVPAAQAFTTTGNLPAPLRITFNWLMTGLKKQNHKE
ncbi:MAG: ABC transporter substrate-binding protein [Desulfobacteraceae bacterium]|nr:ABC transporter substrate-binding protein [Desulfobacteraceae bacterium]